MKTNVGNIVHITNAAFKTNIGVWLNDAYVDAHKRHLWKSIIDDDYTFTSVASQAEYSLPADFEEEVFVANITSPQKLKRYTIQSWWDARALNYDTGVLQDGSPIRYVILYEASKIKLDPPPDTGSETYAMPYKKTITELSDDSDVVTITGLEAHLEAYAISQAFVYKGDFAKADWYANKAELELLKIIANDEQRVNQIDQFVGQTYNPQYDYGQTIGDSDYGI